MAISSIGVGSGLDVESIVTQMVDLEKRSIKTLEAKAEVIQSKISTYGQIKSLTDDLNSAVRDLTLDSGFGAVKINSSNSSAVSATMTGLASQGSYNIDVTQLAQSQTTASVKLGAGKTMGAAGSMQFVLGNPDKAGVQLKTVNVTIAATDKLSDVVANINKDPDLSKSVIASVITDSSGNEQLMIRSRETGLDNQFTVSMVPTDAAAVNAELQAWNAWNTWQNTPVDERVGDAPNEPVNPLSSFAQLADVGGLWRAQEAQNAELKLNGVELESNTNSFKDVVPGLTIAVSATGKSLLSITQDQDATKEKIQKFVDSYNALNEMLSESTKYNAETEVGGVLQGDSSTVSLQNSLRMLTQGIVSNTGVGAFTRLSDIGIQMQQGGKLALDTTKLATALQDTDSLKALFATKSDALGAGGGIAVNFKAFTDSLLAWEGSLNNKTDSLEEQLERNSAEVDKVEKRAESVEARMRAQYTALDVKMASLNSLSSYVEQMVASWNKSKD